MSLNTKSQLLDRFSIFNENAERSGLSSNGVVCDSTKMYDIEFNFDIFMKYTMAKYVEIVSRYDDTPQKVLDKKKS